MKLIPIRFNYIRYLKLYYIIDELTDSTVSLSQILDGDLLINSIILDTKS